MKKNPTTSAQSKACGASMLVRSGASERAQVRMAGNAMHVPCVGAFLIAACKKVICEHIVDLVTAFFLNGRPATPAQSRWTGVPCVARFAFGLYSFHGLLGGFWQALVSGARGGGNPNGGNRNGDNY